MAHSPEFEHFLAGVTAPLTFSRDSFDEIPNIASFHLLGGDEQTAAEDILIAMLTTNDGRAATALADGYCERAIPALIEATTDAAAPVMRVFAARALLRMDNTAGRDSLVRMLREHDGSHTDRGSAARLLAEFPDPDREFLLEVASTDPSDSVRLQATHAVFEIVGLEDHGSGEVLLSVAGRLLSSLTTVRDKALAELRAILAAWDAGATAEDLGLTWEADRARKPLRQFIDDIDSTRADFRVDGLDGLTGRERVLVDNLVLLRLAADRRAVRAAGRLGVRRAIEPLRELLGSAKGHAREEILSVLDSLTASESAEPEEVTLAILVDLPARPAPSETVAQAPGIPRLGDDHVRWRHPLPDRVVTGLAAANGMCFVSSLRGIQALDGPVVRWSVDAECRSCLPHGDGLLVTNETDALRVRDQHTGSVISAIEATPFTIPVTLADGLVVFVEPAPRESVLRAITLTGEVRWEVGLHSGWQRPLVLRGGHVVVTEGEVLRAFDQHGSPLWSANRHEFRSGTDVVGQPPGEGRFDGQPVELPDGNVLVPVLADDMIGYFEIDPRDGNVRAAPAHLRPGEPVVPLGDPETGRRLVVMPGWPETDEYGEGRPTVTVVDVDSGVNVLHHRVPSTVDRIVATTPGTAAVAGSPSWDRWDKYHGWPGFDLGDDCYVMFLDKAGVRAEWKAGKPLTGPIALGARGELLVPVAGELVGLEVPQLLR